jgi:murein L,D-transpeptidase YafK
VTDITRRALMLGSCAILAGCATQPSKFKTYSGPDVTSVMVFKGRREMYLLHNNETLKRVKFELGFAPEGHKEVEGDGRTPEGFYWIDRRNPNSQFHLSLGISYPNENDRARAAAMGKSPGGDIFIHGTPKRYIGKSDWTAGCIAVLDEEMEDIYAMVRDGTPVVIVA